MKRKAHSTVTLYYLFTIILFAAVIAGAGCSDSGDKKDTGGSTDSSGTGDGSNALINQGKEIFYAASTETGLKCASCHSDGTNDDVTLTKYFSPINGADKRTSTYHGMFTGEEVAKNAGGATICWKTYLEYKEDLTPDQINALNAYYESVAKSDDPTEIVYETLALPTRDKQKFKEERAEIIKLTGDKENGQKLFKDACGSCHGKDTGVKDVPNLQEYEGDVKGIAYMTRLGDGHMPFFRKDKLSDQDIADISAFVMTTIVGNK